MKSIVTNRCGQEETCGELKQLNLTGILQLQDVNTLKKKPSILISALFRTQRVDLSVPPLSIAPSVSTMRYLVKLSTGSKECAC